MSLAPSFFATASIPATIKSNRKNTRGDTVPATLVNYTLRSHVAISCTATTTFGSVQKSSPPKGTKAVHHVRKKKGGPAPPGENGATGNFHGAKKEPIKGRPRRSVPPPRLIRAETREKEKKPRRGEGENRPGTSGRGTKRKQWALSVSARWNWPVSKRKKKPVTGKSSLWKRKHRVDRTWSKGCTLEQKKKGFSPGVRGRAQRCPPNEGGKGELSAPGGDQKICRGGDFYFCQGNRAGRKKITRREKSAPCSSD